MLLRTWTSVGSRVPVMTNDTAHTSSGLQGTEAVVAGGTSNSDVSTTIVVAVAEAEGVDPIRMDERLHDWIDPDALERVVRSMDDGHVAFDMADHQVLVGHDGRVSITDHDV